MKNPFIKHLTLISQFELQRLFTTRRGLLNLAAFSAVWCLILIYPIRFAADFYSQSQSANGSSLLDFIGFGSLLNWQTPEFGVYWRFALYLFPMLSIMIASDQTSSDRERGTLRFLTLRTSRDSLFFGRFSGAIVIQLLLILVTLASTLLLIIYREGTLTSSSLNSASAIAINLIIILLPFIALMATLSAAVKSAKQATVWAILILTFLTGLINITSSYLPIIDSLKMLIPGYQMTTLAQLSEWEPLQLAYIPIIQTLVLLAVGRWIMVKQDL
jgi:hypothetical protein